MLKIAICDDNEIQTDILQELFDDYNSVSPYKANVFVFSSGAELLSFISENGTCDIYILDIMMPELNGMEVAKKLRETDDFAKIVFLTTETSYVFKAFSVSASGYLMKPVNPEELFELVNNLRIRIEKEKPSSVILHTDAGNRRVEVKDIVYVDVIDRVPMYHLFNSTVVTGKARRCRFQEMISELLNGYPFALSSAGVAVNLANVESIDCASSELTLKNGEHLLCSRTMKEFFVNRLQDFWNK